MTKNSLLDLRMASAFLASIQKVFCPLFCKGVFFFARKWVYLHFASVLPDWFDTCEKCPLEIWVQCRLCSACIACIELFGRSKSIKTRWALHEPILIFGYSWKRETQLIFHESMWTLLSLCTELCKSKYFFGYFLDFYFMIIAINQMLQGCCSSVPKQANNKKPGTYTNAEIYQKSKMSDIYIFRFNFK